MMGKERILFSAGAHKLFSNDKKRGVKGETGFSAGVIFS